MIEIVIAKSVGWLLVDVNIDYIERHVIEVMLTGAVDRKLMVDKQLSLLRELGDFAQRIPDVEFDSILTPFSNFVKPKALTIPSIPQRKLHYDGVEPSTDWRY